MKQIIRYQKPSILRRICSMAFDAIIFISIGVLLLIAAIQPIMGNMGKYKASYNRYIELSLETKLYEKDETINGPIKIIGSDYDEKLNVYYSSNSLEYTLSDYNLLKSEAKATINSKEYNLFYLDEVSGNYVEFSADESEVDLNKNLRAERITFYSKVINDLIMEEINGRTIKNADGTTRIVGNEELMKTARYINSMTVLSWIIAVILSVCVTYLMFPMIFKDRATLGKKMFHFQVINAKTGFVASRFQIFARFVFFALFNVVGAFLTYGLSILISICMVILTKNRNTLHDLLASTAVVNTSIGSTSQNPQDYIAFEYDDGRPEPEEVDVYSSVSVGEAPILEEAIDGNQSEE